MPELPEVEVVRRGLEKHLVGLHFTEVEVLDSRPLRRHVGGPASFVDQLVGRQVQAAVCRGKFLWLVLDLGAALTAHQGMSCHFYISPSPRDTQSSRTPTHA